MAESAPNNFGADPLNLMRIMPTQGSPSRTGISAMRFPAHGFLFHDRINKMNGASGTSDVEGKAATGSGERGGSRMSFNTMTSEKSNGADSDSVNTVHSVKNPLPNSKKVHVSGTLHPDIQVPFREISLAPTKTMSGEIEVNEPVRVYDT